MRWVKDNLFAFVMVAIFITSSGIYLCGWLKYRGVESWPSVGAEIVRSGGTSYSVPSHSSTGSSSAIVDTSFVEFEYSVNGRTYRSNTATPNRKGLSLAGLQPPWKAFYKPSSPEIAVLAPLPYDGRSWVFVAMATGIMTLMYCWISFSHDSLLVLRRKLLGWRNGRD